MRALIMMASVALAACGDSGIVAPRRQLPPANYTCSNAPMVPAVPFRIVYTPDGQAVDTIGVFTNRYLVPHRSADTVRTLDNHGSPLEIVFGYGGDSSTYCLTLFDSLIHHTPNVLHAIGAS